EDGIRVFHVTGVQTCALPISMKKIINLTPLIDVVFLLLIFFMVSTTFTRETQLKVDLPESVSGEYADASVQQIEVLISVSGEVRSEERRVGKEGRGHGVLKNE